MPNVVLFGLGFAEGMCVRWMPAGAVNTVMIDLATRVNVYCICNMLDGDVGMRPHAQAGYGYKPESALQYFHENSIQYSVNRVKANPFFPLFPLM